MQAATREELAFSRNQVLYSPRNGRPANNVRRSDQGGEDLSGKHPKVFTVPRIISACERRRERAVCYFVSREKQNHNGSLFFECMKKICLRSLGDPRHNDRLRSNAWRSFEPRRRRCRQCARD